MSRGVAPELITSTNNPRIKAIRRLSERHARDETGEFFVEGPRFVHGALASGCCRELVIAAGCEQRSGWLQRAQQTAVPVMEVGERVFASLSRASDPSGVGAVCRQVVSGLPRDDTALCVAVTECEFPGNLGTIIRTCEAGGATLIMVGDGIDPYHPAAVRATMGSIFRVDIARATRREFVAWWRRTGRRIIGSSPTGRAPYRAADYRGPTVLWFGSERRGLDEADLRFCDEVVRIPMEGSLDSLNLAVAAAVVLFEAASQRASGTT